MIFISSEHFYLKLKKTLRLLQNKITPCPGFLCESWPKAKGAEVASVMDTHLNGLSQHREAGVDDAPEACKGQEKGHSQISCAASPHIANPTGKEGWQLIHMIINAVRPLILGSSYHLGGSPAYHDISALRPQIPSDTIPLINSRAGSHDPWSGQGKQSLVTAYLSRYTGSPQSTLATITSLLLNLLKRTHYWFWENFQFLPLYFWKAYLTGKKTSGYNYFTAYTTRVWVCECVR